MGSRGSTFGAVGGGILGAVIGYFAGGPYGAVQGAFIGSSLGMTVGSAVDPPTGKLGDTQYSRQDLYYNTIAHNLPVPIVYGINRVAGNLLWLGNVKVEITTSGGGGKEGGSGGGGKGGSSGTQETTVYADFAIALSEGPIAALTELFIGDKRITNTSGLTYTVYLGTQTQTADPLMVKDLGALAPAFRNTAYVTIGGALGNYPSIPNVNAEIIGRYATDMPSSFTLVASSSPPTTTWSGWLHIHGGMNPGAQANMYWDSDDELYRGPITAYNYHIWIQLDGLTEYETRKLPQDMYFDFLSGPGCSPSPCISEVFEVTTEGIYQGYDFEYPEGSTSAPVAPQQVVTITDVLSGISGKLFLPDDTLVTQEIESNGTITFSIGQDAFTMPLSGYIQLYSDGPGYSIAAENGRWPPDGFATIRPFAEFATEQHYTWGNPAIIIKDVLINKRYGGAIDETRIDSASFAEVYSYCIQDVPYMTATGGTGWEARYCLDYVFDAQAQILDHLRSMLATFGGFLTWSQGTIKLHVERPGETITQSFGMQEIVNDSFKWKRQSYRERPNVIRIEYIEPGTLIASGSDVRVDDSGASASQQAQYWGTDWQIQQGFQPNVNMTYKEEYKVYRQDFVEACDIWDIDRTGERREKIINLTGIKRRSQAQRMAYHYLNKAVFCSHACTFKVAISALEAEVGDIIAVSHDIPRWEGRLFRIAEIQESERDELILGCLEHNDAIYSDSFATTPHGQNTLYGSSSGKGGMPSNVGRLTAYERPNENTMEISYTRITTRDLFQGADLYIQRNGGDWLGIGERILTNAPTAYLRTNIESMVLTQSGATGDVTGNVTIRGVPDGYSAELRRFDSPSWTNTLYASDIATMGTVVLSTDITSAQGYVTLYSDGMAYTTLAPGNWPRAAIFTNFTWHSGDLWDYKRNPHVMTAVQTWIPIERAAGGWTSNQSLRIEFEEIGFETFTNSMLMNATRGSHGTTAVPHTGILSLGMVAIHSCNGLDLPSDVTAAFRNPLTVQEFFGQNSSWLYIGAESKFSTINLWLARNASHPIAMAGEYSTSPGSWASLTTSYFIQPIDTTSAMQWHGQIQLEAPGDWEPAHEVTLGGLNIADTTDRYYVRLMRVASLCITPPSILEMTLTNDKPITVRKYSAFLYELTLQDSGQMLTFKAVSRSMGGLAGDMVAAPQFIYNNDYVP